MTTLMKALLDLGRSYLRADDTKTDGQQRTNDGDGQPTFKIPVPDIQWEDVSKKNIEEVLQDHRNIAQEQFKILYQQQQINVDHGNRIAVNTARIDRVSHDIETLKELLTNKKIATVEKELEIPPRQSTNNGVNPGSGFNPAPGTSRSGIFGTRCIYCNYESLLMEDHIRFYCILAPDQVNGRRRHCQLCGKFYARNYLKTHQRVYCSNRTRNNNED